jgi:hypothetical protein
MEKHRQRRRARPRNDPPEAKAQWRVTHKLKRYGLTAASYTQMLADQGHACAMCGEPFKLDQYIAVDHDHNLGCHPEEKRACDACRRGLLCLRCNTGLGYSERMGELARAYLAKQRHP